MLHELRVNNLALIDSLHLDVSERGAGLIVLTGETGAGKSIILQAVHLLGGGRSSASWVRNGSDSADIQAVFDIHPQHKEALHLLEELSLRDGTNCLVRRKITSQGRSRLYINDGQVTARVAGDLSAGLVNIASQHDNQQLISSRHQLDFLDSYGELWPLRLQFTQLFGQWQKLSSELRHLQEKDQDKDQHKEFLSYQLQEIEQAQPVVGEDEQLQQEKDRMKAATTLAECSQRALQQFSGDILTALSNIRKDMEQVAALDPEAVALSERVISACYEIDDIEQDLARYSETIPTDAARMEQITERLALLKQLQRKYGPTLEEVLERAEFVRGELVELEGLEAKIAKLEKRLEEVSTEAFLKATELSVARRETAQRLKTVMENELASLSFNQALFEVDLKVPEGLGLEGVQSTGRDNVAFLFSANPGEPPKPLASIASGGELSRLMLAMKCILAKRDQVDTVIFDEIDAGIGGEAAEAVAQKIRELAGHHQVFCITHLPQIAAGADLHFKIEKLVDEGRTRTVVNKLTGDDRVAEVARMLGGHKPTAQTLAYAQELVERRSIEE